MDSSDQKSGISGRVLALDFGRVHTGVAISDPTGTIVRPVGDINEAGSDAGLESIARLVIQERVVLVVVGMPVTLAGERGEQARETEKFVAALEPRLEVPVITWDERFTSKLAEETGSKTSTGHGRAAAVLLEDFLRSEKFREMAER